ncbi:IS3 family transposase, partial [Oceanobacillus massiliensis]
LKLEEGWSYRQLRDRFGIKSDAQIAEWVKKTQMGISFEDQRGHWNRKTFSSLEEENAYLKAQVDYPKKAKSKSSRGGEVAKAQRFEVIHQIRSKHPLKWLFSIAEVSKAGYYKWILSRPARVRRQEGEALLKEHILAIHKEHPYFGYKRVTRVLRKEGLLVNHKRTRRLMRDLGIRSVIRKKRPFYGRRGSVLFKNVLNRNFYAEKMYQKLVTDITYIRINDRFVYLSAVLDLHNNEIVAWKLSERNDLDLVLNTLEYLESQPLYKGTLLHSDQGFQYTSNGYAKRLKKMRLNGSHSRRGNCHDNACIESFFSHLKTEKLYLEQPKTYEQAKQMITEYIHFYNTERLQEKHNGLSPIEYREKAAA